MNKIRVLPDELINQIAAGEVVERPASVVKELAENAIDAGASIILIKTEGGGRRLIEVADNGGGMSRDDALLALERHATSKIRDKDDLMRIASLGFRGEALPSIAAVSRMRVTTSLPEAVEGHCLEIDGGRLLSVKARGAPAGTVIEVRNLFYNLPARLKFLKSQATELSHINQAVTRLALAYPSIRFKLTRQGKVVFDLPPHLHLRDRVAGLFGVELARQLLEVDFQEGRLHLTGLAAPPALHRAGRDYQYTFVNHRAVHSNVVGRASRAAFRHLLPQNRHAVWFLFIKTPHETVDVNVHPAKLEVRFRNHHHVYHLVERGLKTTLQGSLLAPRQRLVTEGGEKDLWRGRVREALDKHCEEAAAKAEREAGDSSAPLSYVSREGAELTRSIPKKGMRVCSPREEPLYGAEKAPVEAKAPQQGPSLLGKGDFWEGVTPLGQLHRTYLLCQTNDELVVVDQHAAHERVLYEKLLAGLEKEGKAPRQRLLFPVQVELTPRQRPLVERQVPLLESLGFELSLFGDKTLMVMASPTFLSHDQVEPYMADILDGLVARGSGAKHSGMRDALLERLACHSSVRAGQALSFEEIVSLLEQLKEADFPFHCPHGRPTVIRFPVSELARRFKRT